MGILWAAAAFFLPGIPQLIHLDILKALIIWLFPGLAFFIFPPAGAAAGIFAFIYNLYTAFEY